MSLLSIQNKFFLEKDNSDIQNNIKNLKRLVYSELF